MKTRIYIIITVLALAVLLSACSGGGATANSWPGLSIDSSGEVVYVADKNGVYAVNTSNGTEKWRFPAEKSKSTFYAPPAESDDGQIIIGGYDKTLYGVNKENGNQNWAFYEAKHNYVAGPLVGNDLIYAPSSDNNLYAVDLDGNLKWQFETEYPQWGTPAMDDDTIYLSSLDHHIYALDAKSGKLVWQSDDLSGAIQGSPTLSPDGKLFIGTLGSGMYALDTMDGSTIWQTPTDGWVFSSPVLYQDSLIFGDLTGTVYSLKASDGSINWQVVPDTSDRKKAITEKLLLYQDTLYFGNENGVFYSMNPENGTVNWSKPFDAKIFSTPVATDDLVIMALMGKESLLVAVDIDGTQRWTFLPAK